MHTALLALTLLQPTTAPADVAVEADTIRVVSYNIENFTQNFTAYALDRKYRQNEAVPEDIRDFIRYERRADREENWEVAETIKAMQPDILAVQESASLENLAYFNESFLDNYFGTIQNLPTNTTREQHLTIMLRPGFEIVETVTLYEVPDVNDYNDRGDRLFARGAGFVLIKTPDGDQFWVGNTHQKSKGGNSVRTTRWRNLEATTTRDKAIELSEQHPVLLVGDMNDTLGIDEHEDEGGGDVMTNMSQGLILLTRELSDDGVETFKGYGGARYGGFIDHALATDNMLPFVVDVSVFTGGMTDSASDHLPVVVDVKFE
ncbi:MAG: endonuclease/exonuclease/phosphatase family protein [Planctomycetota bacterium]